VLVQSSALEHILAATQGISFLESFMAGLFFTSAFTTIPAIAILGEIARDGNVITVAFFGAMGAVVGDFVIFTFVRDRLAEDLLHMLSAKRQERLKHLVERRLFRWITPLLAGAIIASPLPDELAIAVLGSSRLRTALFLPFSFVANFIGILIIGLIAQQVL
jgi:hypothetical protein